MKGGGDYNFDILWLVEQLRCYKKKAIFRHPLTEAVSFNSFPGLQVEQGLLCLQPGQV